FFFFSSRRRHTRSKRDWSSDVCSSDLVRVFLGGLASQLGGRLIHGVLVLIPGQLEGFARFLGPGGKRNGAKKLLRERSEGRGVSGTVGCRFHMRRGRLRERAGGKDAGKNQ